MTRSKKGAESTIAAMMQPDYYEKAEKDEKPSQVRKSRESKKQRKTVQLRFSVSSDLYELFVQKYPSRAVRNSILEDCLLFALGLKRNLKF